MLRGGNENVQRFLQSATGTKLDAQAAANVWAGTSGLSLLRALNAKAGTTGKDLAHVCALLGIKIG